MNTVQGLELQKRMREFDEEHNKDDKSMRRINRQEEQRMDEAGDESYYRGELEQVDPSNAKIKIMGGGGETKWMNLDSTLIDMIAQWFK